MAKIILDSVGLTYPVYGASSRSLKKSLISVTTGGMLGSSDKHVLIEALRNISFSLSSGDRLGLVGHNGAGKSSLLRILAKIYEPSVGDVTIDGDVSALFDIALGMDLESTGYENIIIRGLLLGLSEEEMKRLTPEIEVFTEMGDFLSMPIKTYSSGMKVRLAFGIVTAVSPSILLMDEVIGAGDARFMEKARERLEAFIHRADILVIASHDNDMIQKFCNKALWLEHGIVRALGPTEEVLAQYTVRH